MARIIFDSKNKLNESTGDRAEFKYRAGRHELWLGSQMVDSVADAQFENTNGKDLEQLADNHYDILKDIVEQDHPELLDIMTNDEAVLKHYILSQYKEHAENSKAAIAKRYEKMILDGIDWNIEMSPAKVAHDKILKGDYVAWADMDDEAFNTKMDDLMMAEIETVANRMAEVYGDKYIPKKETDK